MTRRLTTEEFIYKAKGVHGDRYDYSLTTYHHSQVRVAIECRKHGFFHQWPYEHLRGSGCPDCGADDARGTTVGFIQRATKKHGNRYNYESVVYRHSHSKVMITCTLHGHFLQTPNNHLAGRGCPDCGKLISSAAVRNSAGRTC